jgi:hypothetical protein
MPTFGIDVDADIHIAYLIPKKVYSLTHFDVDLVSLRFNWSN